MRCCYLPLFFASMIPFAVYGASKPPVTRILDGMNACFILYDLKRDRIVERYGEKWCTERRPPCSTFKVPLALMAFDRGILKDATTLVKWNGQTYFRKSWERDQDARSWLKESVLWVSQNITRKLGRETIAKYLRDFKYGNTDMSGGLETAWLSPDPDLNSTVQPSITISADEQITFFKKLWRNDLPVTKQAMDLTREFTYWETSPQGYTLHGKTGSGYAGKGTKRRLGWFVGRLAKGTEEYIGVVTFTDIKEPMSEADYGGPKSREMFKTISQEMGYW